uniref:Protein tyrosine phosphatase n=1 Tax=Kalmanozyma brasiliensis (strain GHG001) TaxID=1365824 RepID=V5ECM5_KALBG
MSLGVRPSRRALSSLYQALDFTDHLRLSEPDLGYTTIRSTSTENIDANRYRDILAYDHALLPGPYLNAAYIPPFHPTSVSFIISQAPPPDTYTAFYTHIVQQRVRVLVNLTPLIEKGRRKADQYWPNHSVGVSGSEGDAEMELGNGWKVTSESEKQIELQQGEATLVAMPKIYPPPPTWIHCSAGVGRSGTLAAAYIARAAINVARHEGTLAGDADDSLMARNQRSHVWDLPVRIVEHLRRYRARMVQTIEQFEAVYEIVGELAKQAGSAEK